jgi:HEAT repeat protein
MSELRLSFVLSALGRIAASAPQIAEPDLLPVVRRVIREGRGRALLSAIIALGNIGERSDLSPETRSSLVRLLAGVTRDRDFRAEHLTSIALGRIGAATPDVRLRERTFDVLRARVSEGRYVGSPYAAFGLVCHARGAERTERHRAVLRGALRRQGVKDEPLAAYALALGLLGDREVVPDLVALVRDEARGSSVRTHAVALAILGDPCAAGAVREVLVSGRALYDRLELAVAAARLDRGGVMPVLLADLDRHESISVRGSTALALGRIGDPRALGPLVRAARDEDGRFLHRALAVVAIGLLLDENDPPVLSRLSRDVNFWASVPAVEEALCIMVR